MTSKNVWGCEDIRLNNSESVAECIMRNGFKQLLLLVQFNEMIYEMMYEMMYQNTNHLTFQVMEMDYST